MSGWDSRDPCLCEERCAGACSGRGQAQHGELGYGPKGKKSSANPDKCLALEGIIDPPGMSLLTPITQSWELFFGQG